MVDERGKHLLSLRCSKSPVGMDQNESTLHQFLDIVNLGYLLAHVERRKAKNKYHELPGLCECGAG